jgi:apolipoprotein N-acyltransferase
LRSLRRPSLERRWWRRLAIASGGVAAGLACSLSLPPVGIWPLALLTPAYPLILLERRGLRAGLLAAYCFGAGLYSAGLYWVTSFARAGWLALTLIEPLYLMLGLVPAAALPSRSPPWIRAAVAAVGLTCGEVLRENWPFGGMALAGPALALASSPLAPLARLGGAPALSAACFLAGSSVALLVRTCWSRKWAHALAALLWAAALGAGTIAGYAAAGRAHGELRVAAVQGGGRRGLHAVTSGDQLSVFYRQMQVASRLPEGAYDLVVMPEDALALPDYGKLTSDTPYLWEVSRLARIKRAYVLIGVTEDVGSRYFRNEVLLFAPNGGIAGVYEKEHRVPFGEFIPARRLFSVFGQTRLVPRDAIPGRSPGLLCARDTCFGVMISYEVFYDQQAQAPVSRGAKLLVVATNTASYATSQVPAQELAAARLRAIETGRYLVMSSTTGYSAVISPSGAVLSRSRLSKPATVEGRLGEISYATPFDVIGPQGSTTALLALLAGLWLLGLLPELRARKSEASPPGEERREASAVSRP